jgi:hypothetical protein
MKKYLVIASILSSGCATYVGVDNPRPLNPVPIYAPMYDTMPTKIAIDRARCEARKLKQFVYQDRNLIRLIWALDAYETASNDLMSAINTAPPATISYRPWQVTNR